MPRIENLGANVDAECKTTGNGSSTHDVCCKCFGVLKVNPHAFDQYLIPYNGESQGVDGWGGDVGTPDLYENMNAEPNGWRYKCEVCNKRLGRNDN